MRVRMATPQVWYGALTLEDGSLQFVEARTLPRPPCEPASEEKDTPFTIMTDPVRASWPSR